MADEICQNEGRASAFALDRVDQDLASAVQCLIDKSIRDPEVLLSIFLWFIIKLQVEIFEVAIALGVSLASDIQNVCHTGLNQLKRLEGALEGAHVNTWVHLEQAYVANGFLAIHVASTEVNVGEAPADDLLLKVL